MFTTWVLLSIGGGVFMFSAQISSCLMLMVFSTDPDLSLRSSVSKRKVLLSSSSVGLHQVSFSAFLVWLWQINTQALIQCQLALSIIRLKTGWWPRALNLKDYSILA